MLKTPWGQVVFAWVGAKINHLLDFSFVGSEFVFGKLGVKGGGLPVMAGEPMALVGFIFAFQVLPTIIFVAALFAILYHLGVMQVIVKAVAQGDDAPHGRQRGREPERGRLDLHGPDRGAAHHPAVPQR